MCINQVQVAGQPFNEPSCATGDARFDATQIREYVLVCAGMATLLCMVGCAFSEKPILNGICLGAAAFLGFIGLCGFANFQLNLGAESEPELQYSEG